MPPRDHDHPVSGPGVAAARAGALSVGDAGRLAGLVSFRKDGRVVYYRLSDGFPHPLLEHCLRQLLTIAAPEADDARG